MLFRSFRKRLNASWISADVQGFAALADFFAARGCPDLAAAFFADLPCLRDFLTRLRLGSFDFGGGLRVIFDMIRVY